MQYFVAAGLCADLLGDLKQTLKSELNYDCVIGSAIKLNRPYTYTREEVLALAGDLRTRLAAEIESGKTIFVSLLYVPHRDVNNLIDVFGPSTLHFRLPGDLNHIDRRKAYKTLMRVVRNAQNMSRKLNKIFESKIRRSPIPLPLRNYDVPNFFEKLCAIAAFNHDQDPADIEEISGLPTANTVSPKTTVYCDRRNLLFIPAKRREFHGHEVSGDLPFTWLHGVFRIGRSIPVGFHYDVKPDRPPLSRFTFVDCEKGAVRPGDDHAYANVTPNDRIRFGKQG